MTARFKQLRVRQLSESLEALAPLRAVTRPRGGWIRAIRSALGMSAVQLGRRLGVTQSAASYYERSEASDTINLGTLRKVAAALDCELVYALVPRESLEEIRARRAREVAERRVVAVSESMALEEQDISAEARAKQVEELAQALLADWPRTIWDDR